MYKSRHRTIIVQYDMSNATGSPKQLYNFNSRYSKNQVYIWLQDKLWF